jgi:tetratricopeptide (TPR) repeat protein
LSDAYHDYQRAGSLGDGLASDYREYVSRRLSSALRTINADEEIEDETTDPTTAQAFRELDQLIIDTWVAEHPKIANKHDVDWIKNLMVLEDRGDACYATGDDNGAIQYYNQILGEDHEDEDMYSELGDEHIEVLWRRGEAYFRAAHYSAAIHDYTRVLKLRPQLTALYIERAKANAELGEREAVTEDYDRASEQDNGLAFLHINQR